MLKLAGHGKAVDWYLLGVVFYEMLVGVPPYYASTKEQLFKNIEKAPLKVPTGLSLEAKSLIKGLLQRDPTRRLGSEKGHAEEIKSHPFFTGVDWTSVYQRKIKMPEVALKKVNDCIPVDSNSVYQDTKLMETIEGWSFVHQG